MPLESSCVLENAQNTGTGQILAMESKQDTLSELEESCLPCPGDKLMH